MKTKLASGLLISLLIGTQANASTYRCAVEGVEDYAVEVNLNTHKAAFFDNNEWIVLHQDEIGDSGAAYFSQTDSSGAYVSIKMDLTEGQEQQSSLNLIYGGDDIITPHKLDCAYAQELASGI